MNLIEKIITVTGGAGFLGTHVCEALTERGLNNCGYVQRSNTLDSYHAFTGDFNIPRSKDFDLTVEKDVDEMYSYAQPDIVIHLAAVVGGIGANRKYPGTYYYKNLIMGALLMEHARRRNIEKFVAVGTICAYPKFCTVPFKEEDLWEGYPEETNAPYGIAKKAMLVQAQSYRQEFGFNSIYLLPVNLDGPGDNFNPESSHVIPALIKKCIDARNSRATSIECWGTGKATREFLYVKDAAEAIILATENYDGAEPVNLGAGVEISIAQLIETIAKLTKFTGKVIWNDNYPDGQPRRCLDTRRAKSFGFTASTPFEDGLAATIEWYERTSK
jgi:GDP-L-fucose synthase